MKIGKHLILALLWALVVWPAAWAYPPDSEDEQAKKATLVAWCDVVSIDPKEELRRGEGMTSQIKKFTLKVSEVIRGEMPAKGEFSVQYAEYQVTDPEKLKQDGPPEILIWESYRRPRIEHGRQYKVYLYATPEGVKPVSDRWSILHARVDPKIFEKWTGQPEPKPGH